MNKRIAVLPGDGIGPEVVEQAVRVLQAVAQKYGHHFEFYHSEIGGAAFEKYGKHFPDTTKELCSQVNAILLGSVGGPVAESHLLKWQNCERNSLLQLRKQFSFNANIRPLFLDEKLIELCPLKRAAQYGSLDLVVIRELIGDIYFGKHERSISDGIRSAIDVASYDEKQIYSVAKVAFELAKARRGKVTSVDKANVLETSRLWREVVNEVALSYPEIKLEHILVDNCAMKMVQNPWDFDVLLTPNLFGDILSDLGASLIGSLGLLPSASINTGSGFGLYEPAGGSAPDIAGKNQANPIAQILSAAMLLRHSFKMFEEASAIEKAVGSVLKNGFRTRDLWFGSGARSEELLSTVEMTDAIIRFLGDL